MIPKYLFHYTSIESVKKILCSRKIRFTRLDLLNDPYEGDFSFSDIEVSQSSKRKLIYCSCWNGAEEESVNLWHIYTNMKGVRIKLKSSMFSKDIFLREQPSGFVPVSKIPDLKVSIMESQTDAPDKINRVYGPLKIDYVSKFEDTYASAVARSIANSGAENMFNMYDVNLLELGIKKVKHWEYENEWRYKVSPYIELHGSKSAMEAPFEIKTPEYIDVPFVEEICEILLAPQVTDREYEDLILFMKTNNINASIRRSSIKYRN